MTALPNKVKDSQWKHMERLRILVIDWSLNTFVPSQGLCCFCADVFPEIRNTGLGVFQYALVRWWTGSDGWKGMRLVSGLQLFNLWRIIKWRRLQFVAQGDGESDRRSTDTSLPISHGQKEILFTHYSATRNTTVDSELHWVAFGIKITLLRDLCGIWNRNTKWVWVKHYISWTSQPISLPHIQQYVWARGVRLGSHLLLQSLCKVDLYMQTVFATCLFSANNTATAHIWAKSLVYFQQQELVVCKKCCDPLLCLPHTLKLRYGTFHSVLTTHGWVWVK